jgi:transposase InsO family protein
MAQSRRVVEPGLVHHSDRRSQYASKDYTHRASIREFLESLQQKKLALRAGLHAARPL